MRGHRKTRFVWADGRVDYRHIPDHAVWRRFRWDRDDVPKERLYELLNGCLNYPTSDGLPCDTVTFERVRHSDGSVEMREVLRG